MSKYLKLFNNHSEYDTFTGSTEFITPNVSHTIQENEVMYNPKEDEPTFDGKWKGTYANGHIESAVCDSSSVLLYNEIPDRDNIVSVEIGDCVTSIYNTFFACTKLTSVTIPNSVTSIENYAFYGCSSLTSITVEATTPPTIDDSGVFTSTNDCPIYVPAESVDTYKSATNWSSYASRIQAIP